MLVQHLDDGDTIFLDLDAEAYYALDAVGTAMWHALTTTGREDRALDELQEVFQTDAEALSRDLEALVDRLAARGLLRVCPDPSGAMGTPDSS